MTRSRSRGAVGACAMLLLLSASPAAADEDTHGQRLYRQYCSACHGQDGKGDGVVGWLMRPQPPDLTKIAARNGGTFDAAAVSRTIDGRHTVRAHGDPNMPVWGEVLTTNREGTPTSEAAAETKIADITAYLATIQVK